MLAMKRVTTRPVTGSEDEISNLVRQVEDLSSQLKMARAHECDLECELNKCKKKLQLMRSVWINRIVKFFKDSKTDDSVHFN